MTETLIALSFWLHSLATVVMIGHYLLLALIYLPAMRKSPLEVTGPILSGISRQSRLWLYTSLAIFFLTGVYLMFADPNYLGVGQFENTWSILMLVKHLLIVAMIGMGFWFNAILRVGPMLSSRSSAEQAYTRFRMFVNLMAASGVLVLLLTAMSQVQ